MGPLSLDLAARLTAALVGIAGLIDAAELVVARREFATGGTLDYAVIRTLFPTLIRPPVARFTDRLYSYRGSVGLAVVSCILSALLILNNDPRLSSVIIGLSIVTLLTLQFRQQYGLDGSDQMQIIVLAGLFVFYATDVPYVRIAGQGFIAGQSILSYLTAGIAKLRSPVWRSGNALLGILDTQSYGSPGAVRLLARSAVVRHVGTWTVLGFECLLPFAPLFGVAGAVAFVAVGIAFHAVISVTMGLNAFFWSFVSTYPAVLALTIHFWHVVPS